MAQQKCRGDCDLRDWSRHPQARGVFHLVRAEVRLPRSLLVRSFRPWWHRRTRYRQSPRWRGLWAWPNIASFEFVLHAIAKSSAIDRSLELAKPVFVRNEELDEDLRQV